MNINPTSFYTAIIVLAVAGPSIAAADQYSPGDCNCDGVVDMADIADITTYFGDYWGDGYARPGFGDADHDGEVTQDDYDIWVDHWTDEYFPPAIDSGAELSVAYSGGVGEVEIIDIADEFDPITIMAETDLQVWDDCPSTDALTPSVSFVAKSDGYDLVYTFDNTMGTGNRSPGILLVPGLALGATAWVRKFDSGGLEEELSSVGCCHPEHEWPTRDWYSPVGVIRNADYCIGASIQYPVLNYKHSVRVAYANHSYMGTTYRFVAFRLGDCASDADLAPGEIRKYTVSVRVLRIDEGTDHENEWLRTLQEYRRYFRCMYQAVRYQRDSTPVWAWGMTDPSAFSYSAHGYLADRDPTLTRTPSSLSGWGKFADLFDGACDGRN